nr:hypothetical protein CFP56_07024 [Quercus suber]
MSLRRNFVAESTDLSADRSQQNLLNFRSTEYFLREISFSGLFQKCEMSLRRNFVAEITDPSVDCSQQNLLNFKSAECSSTEYFIAENFRSQNVDLFADYLQQNLLKGECSVAEFHSRIPEMQNVHWQDILQQNSRDAERSSAEYFAAEFQKCKMFIGRIFRSRKFQKTKVQIFRQTVHGRIC